jgi:hypothetical protein
MGESCNQCHTGGTAPVVTLEGPSTLAAGQTADYALVVKTGQSRATGAIAVTDGVVLAPLTGVRDSFGEMVPNGSALAVAGGQVKLTFRVTAPMSGTSLRLWAVGLAATGSAVSGDKAAHTLRDITVTGGTPPKPDAGSSSGSEASTPGTDAGSNGSSGTSGTGDGTSGTTGTGDGTSGTSGASGTSGTSGTATGDEDLTDEPGPRSSPHGTSGADAASCSSAAARLGQGGGAGGAVLVALGSIALMVSERRRRRRA